MSDLSICRSVVLYIWIVWQPLSNTVQSHILLKCRNTFAVHNFPVVSISPIGNKAVFQVLSISKHNCFRDSLYFTIPYFLLNKIFSIDVPYQWCSHKLSNYICQLQELHHTVVINTYFPYVSTYFTHDP